MPSICQECEGVKVFSAKEQRRREELRLGCQHGCEAASGRRCEQDSGTLTKHAFVPRNLGKIAVNGDLHEWLKFFLVRRDAIEKWTKRNSLSKCSSGRA